jgi:quercetin dioxygenase-like cupin family protein
MTSPNYTLFDNLVEEVEIPNDGILSKPIFSDERLRITLFGMSAGQEMSEHTTSMEAMVHFLEGEIEVTVEGNVHTARAGTWVLMSPRVPHSLIAKTPSKFCLTVLRK